MTQTTYNFLVKAPTTLVIRGTIHRYGAGACFSLPHDEAQLVVNKQLDGSEHTMLVSVTDPEEEKKIMTDAASEPSQKMIEPPVMSDEDLTLLNHLNEEGAVIDQVQEHLQEVASDGTPNWSEIAAEVAEAQAKQDEENEANQVQVTVDSIEGVEKLEEEQDEMAKSKLAPLPADPTLPVVPLADDAHWSSVKAFLMDTEESKDFAMVKAIQRKFPNYKVVQEEATRILEAEPASK